MVTLLDRRDYYDNQNGTKTVLAMVGGALVIPEFNHLGKPQQATTEILGAIPDQEVQDYLAEKKISKLELEIDTVCAGHVSCHIDPVEKAHWMGMALALDRKQALWQADQLNDSPEPLTFPPLTNEESTLWLNLSVIQGLTANCRDAATAITNSLYTMTSEEINALPADWVSTHIEWP